jgi:hypothetical protein
VGGGRDSGLNCLCGLLLRVVESRKGDVGFETYDSELC